MLTKIKWQTKERLVIISQREFYAKILKHTTSQEPYVPGTRTLPSHKANSHFNEDYAAAEEMWRPSVACHSYQVLHTWLITDYETGIPHWIGGCVCVCVCACVSAIAQFVSRSLKEKHCVFRMPPTAIIKKVEECAPVWNTNSLNVTFIHHHKVCAFKICCFIVKLNV
jgi:hypothetical protein